MPPTKTGTSRSTANGVKVPQSFRVNGRRSKLRTALPKLDRARSRFARELRRAARATRG
jgi:hypothetical protein